MGDATGVVGLGFGVNSSLGAHLEPLRRTSRGPRAAPCSHPPFPPSLPSSRGEIWPASARQTQKRWHSFSKRPTSFWQGSHPGDLARFRGYL